MYRVSGVDFDKLFEYQKTDPALWNAIVKARAAGDIPKGLYMPYKYEIGGGWGDIEGVLNLICAQSEVMEKCSFGVILQMTGL
jgi:hypothetical protein